MKRASLRAFVCALLASLALTTFAFADSGPKPQLTVRVENAPQELYYLDLLAKGDWDAEDGNSIDGIDWNYDGKEDTLDPDLLALLRENVPEGWHACVAQGTTGAPMWGELYAEGTDAFGNDLHVFGYHGVPSTYRIILVTQSGKVWLSEALERKVLQSSVTVHWADDAESTTVTVPSTVTGYLLQFLATLVPTLLIEGILLLLFRYSWKENWKAFLLVNLVTQGGSGGCKQRSEPAKRRSPLELFSVSSPNGGSHSAHRDLSLRRPRPSHRPQQGPRRALCRHGELCLSGPRLLPCRARLELRRVCLVNTIRAAAFSDRRTPRFPASLT